jgi:hypothetical protein
MKMFVEYQNYAYQWLRYGTYHNSINAYKVALAQSKAKRTRVRIVDERRQLLDIFEQP